MKSLRVLALVPEGQIPPDDTEGLTYKEVAPWKMEYDVVAALDHLGHEVQLLDVGYDLAPIRESVAEWQPHIVFNMLEEFHGIPTFDQNVVAYLELLQVPYTGCNPRGLVLSRDKALAKKILSYHRIPTPGFVSVRYGQKPKGTSRMRYPLFVKSLAQDASAGISQASIVHDEQELRARIEFIHDLTKSHALVEEFIEGRELYVAVIGNERLRTFPVWELDMTVLPDGAARIATQRVKFDLGYQDRHKIDAGLAKDLPPGAAELLAKVGKRIYRVLGLSGYARIDIRLGKDGKPYVLEANPNPDLSSDEEFALACEAGGLAFEPLIQRILNFGLRWHEKFC